MDKQIPQKMEQLRDRFTQLTRLLYDTSVPMPIVERDVFPYFAHNVEFLDPLVHAAGIQVFKRGRHGFHCTFKFDFDITQVGIQLNERGDEGRAMVDGIMNLRSLVVYTYPLRTMLVYDFVLTDADPGLSITRVEEMWSVGDLFANLPIVGRLYDRGRHGFSHVVLGLFAVTCALRGR